MTRTGPLPLPTSDTWKYALVGGLAGLLIGVAGYLQTGAGDAFSLDGAFVGGAVAGYLATASRTEADAGSASVRAGLVGGLPALWILADVFDAASALARPLWFQVAAFGGVVGTILMVVLGVAVVLGAIGGKVGAWIAGRRDDEAPSAAGT